MAYIPESNSVVAFQSKPSSLLVGASVIGLTPVAPTPASVYVVNPVSTLAITTGNSSVTAFQGGAWSTSVTGGYLNVIGSILTIQTTSTNVSVITVGGSTGNSSVQLLGGVATIGSVTAIQGTNPYIVTGSVQGVMSVLGTVPVTQSTTPWIVGSVLLGSSNASIITVGGSTGNSSVQLLGGVAVLGSVATLQGTNPWITQVIGSVLAIQTTSTNVSIITVGGSSGNSSVQLLNGENVIGSVAVLQGTNPWKVNVPTPSYIAYQLAGSLMAVSGSFSGGNSSVELLSTSASIATQVNNILTGVSSVMLFGSTNTSIRALVYNQLTGTSSVQLMAGTNNAGSITAIQGTNPWIISNTSVTAFQGGTWATSIVGVANIGGSVLVHTANNSIITAPQPASVLAFQGTLPWVIQSVVGTYAEDAAHATADKGLFVLGVRNDAASSITTAERDYSPYVVDDVGRTIIKPFAGEQACIISYFGSVVSASVTLIQPSVTGSKSYITDFWVANTGSVAQLVTFQGGDTSVLGFTIAPAGGGSNSPGIAIPLKTTLSQDLAFKVTGTSSVVYMTVKGYQAP